VSTLGLLAAKLLEAGALEALWDRGQQEPDRVLNFAGAEESGFGAREVEDFVNRAVLGALFALVPQD
jgi:hypothetical protein